LSRRELPNGLRPLVVLWLRYARADRPGKSKILDQFTSETGYSRRYAISPLRRPPREPARTRRRRRRVCALSSRRESSERAMQEGPIFVWETRDRICSKRLQGILNHIVHGTHALGDLRPGKERNQLLMQTSSSTTRRFLRPVRAARSRQGCRITRGMAGVKQSTSVRTPGPLPPASARRALKARLRRLPWRPLGKARRKNPTCCTNLRETGRYVMQYASAYGYPRRPASSA
jgi:hypothetical protein